MSQSSKADPFSGTGRNRALDNDRARMSDLSVPATDSLNDDEHNAQAITEHPFGDPYPHGPEHHEAGAGDVAVPGGVGPDGAGLNPISWDSVPRSKKSTRRHDLPPTPSKSEGPFPAPLE